MKKRQWKKAAVLLFLTVFLTSCSGVAQDADRRSESALLLPWEETEGRSVGERAKQIVLLPEAETAKRDLGAWTRPAVLTPDAQELILTEQGLVYGELEVLFPTAIPVEIVETGQTGVTVDLPQAWEWCEWGTMELAPRIRFSYYKAEYETSDALRSALLELIPDAVLTAGYEDAAQGEFYYRIKSGEERYYYYALVRGAELYLVQELFGESDYSFGYLLTGAEAVRWHTDGKALAWGECRDLDDRKLTPEEGVSFVCRYDRAGESLLLFLDGWFERPYQRLSLDRLLWNTFSDWNFDGYVDICAQGRYYLWNSARQQYEIAAVESGEDGFAENQIELLAETGTIWSHDRKYVAGSWEFIEDTEALWQWENNTLVKRRECVLSESEAGVQITCCEAGSDEPLFSEWIRAEEWAESAERVQRLYEAFYDGLAPKEAYALRHVRRYDAQEYIPQKLADGLAEAMLAGTDAEYLKAMQTGRELTWEEELRALAKENPDIRLDFIRDWGDAVLEADMDNDGVADILIQGYYGGSHGYADYVLFKGMPDGKFVESSRVDTVVQEFGVLCYEGKNYLWQKNFDYGSKMDSGYTLSYYADGVMAERVELWYVPRAYDIRLEEYADEQYRSLAEDTMAAGISCMERTDEYEVLIGSAESETEEGADEQFRCDVDNDGEAEAYTKRIWTPSNLGTVTGIIFMGEEDAGLQQAKDAAESGAGDLIMLWFDRCGEKNILNALYRTGLNDFEITGWLVTENEYEAVYRITADAAYEVKQGCIRPFRREYSAI